MVSSNLLPTLIWWWWVSSTPLAMTWSSFTKRALTISKTPGTTPTSSSPYWEWPTLYSNLLWSRTTWTRPSRCPWCSCWPWWRVYSSWGSSTTWATLWPWSGAYSTTWGYSSSSTLFLFSCSRWWWACWASRTSLMIPKCGQNCRPSRRIRELSTYTLGDSLPTWLPSSECQWETSI